jgi:hypothetical protein
MSIHKHSQLWLLSVFYLAAILAFSGLSTVLGVIFVLDTVRATMGVSTDPFPIALSADIPARGDMCSTSLSQGTCAYDLATTALSSQLITHTPYTVAGVTFSAPNGTFGIPYGPLEYFASKASSSLFGDEKRQYCLPILNPKLVTCVLDDTTDTGTKRAFYDVGHALHTYDNATWIYPVTIDPDSELYKRVYVSTMTGYGTMTIAQSAIPGDEDTTIITAQGSYANLLSNMMNINSTDYYFTAICTMNDLTKTKYSSWKWTSLTLENGVNTADVTEESCRSEMEAAYFSGITGFASLPFAIQASTKILGGIDGYSKLINFDSFNTSFSQLTMAAAKEYASANDMTLLESTLSQLYGIVQTSWTALDNDSIAADRVQLRNIFQRDFPHNFIIKTFWTPSAITAMILAALILLLSVWQAIRWLIAIHRLGKDTNGWQLLEPVELMAYSFRAIDDLGPHINTAEARQSALQSKGGPILVDYSKDDLIRLTSPIGGGAPLGNSSGTPPADDKEGPNAEEAKKSGVPSENAPAPGIRSPPDDEEGPTVTEARKSGTPSESLVDTENTVVGD